MRLLGVAAASLALVATSTLAAADERPVLGAPGDRHSWTGSAPVPTNPVPTQPPVSGCLGADAPVCDHEEIEIVNSGSPIRVVIAIAGHAADEDYDLFVYDAEGELVASSASSGGSEQVELFDPPSGVYDIAVQPYFVRPESTYRGSAQVLAHGGDHGPYDLFSDDCLELVPASAAPPMVADVGQRVELDVLVLHDGISRASAKRHMADARRSYEAMGIDLAITYRKIAVPADGTHQGRPTAEGVAVNQFARELLDGRRPPGIDVVYTLSAKDLWFDDGGERNHQLLGVADCIGGVRHPHRAFATGEFTSIDGPTFRGLEFFPVRGYRTTAHEIGHLMGAHHHYFNCVEGIPTELDAGEISPCTVMAPYVDLQSDNFGQVEVAVIRGHAISYAADD